VPLELILLIFEVLRVLLRESGWRIQIGIQASAKATALYYVPIVSSLVLRYRVRALRCGFEPIHLRRTLEVVTTGLNILLPASVSNFALPRALLQDLFDIIGVLLFGPGFLLPWRG
jgi:hypothetical protein